MNIAVGTGGTEDEMNTSTNANTDTEPEWEKMPRGSVRHETAEFSLSVWAYIDASHQKVFKYTVCSKITKRYVDGGQRSTEGSARETALNAAKVHEIWSNRYCARERIAYIHAHRHQFEFNDLSDMLACVRGEYFSGYASELLS